MKLTYSVSTKPGEVQPVTMIENRIGVVAVILAQRATGTLEITTAQCVLCQFDG